MRVFRLVLLCLLLAVSCSAPAAVADGRQALPVVPVFDWSEAAEHVGERVVVVGKVVATYNSGRAVFLNYHQDRKGRFSCVIFPDTWAQFPSPPETLLRGKELRVRGTISEYQGAPQIIIDSIAQLAWADGTPLVAAETTLELPAPGPRAAGVRIVTWNLENFLDSYDDPYTADEQTRPPSVSEARMQRVASALRLLNADVVCLQEVENRGLLEEFNRRMLAGLGYEAVLVEGNDGRGIDVAMLTRLPVLSVTSHRNLRFPGPDGLTRFRRDLLRVELGGALAADVYVVHLKSQLGDAQADAVREAEARTAAAIVAGELAVDPDYRALVAGDFNEVADRPTLRIFRGAGLRDPLAGSKAYSYHPAAHRSRIDYLLCSASLAATLVEDSARVVSELPGVALREASDHFPVVLELTAVAAR